MKTWKLRMVGGPYDGHEATERGEPPPHFWHYAGLPNAWRVRPTAADFFKEVEIGDGIGEHFRRFGYRILAVMEVDYQPTALYVFDDSSTKVDYPQWSARTTWSAHTTERD